MKHAAAFARVLAQLERTAMALASTSAQLAKANAAFDAARLEGEARSKETREAPIPELQQRLG
jgi:hypothetical protein